jgi:hypothetical protein
MLSPDEDVHLDVMRALVHSKLPPIQDPNVLEKLLVAMLVPANLPDGLRLTAGLYAETGKHLFAVYATQYPDIQFQVVETHGGDREEAVLLLSLKPVDDEAPPALTPLRH